MGKRFREVLGEKVSEGVRLIWDVMEKRELNAEQITRELGLKRGVVSKWIYADGRPDLDSAVKIQKKYGIPVAAWCQPPRTRIHLPRPPSDR